MRNGTEARMHMAHLENSGPGQLPEVEVLFNKVVR